MYLESKSLSNLQYWEDKIIEYRWLAEQLVIVEDFSFNENQNKIET